MCSIEFRQLFMRINCVDSFLISLGNPGAKIDVFIKLTINFKIELFLIETIVQVSLDWNLPSEIIDQEIL